MAENNMAGVAQMRSVERRDKSFENPCVEGSIPSPATNLSDYELLSLNALSTDRVDLHAFSWRQDAPPPASIPLAEKMKHCVWSGERHHVIQLPADPDWLQREGYDMQHCLQYLHHRYAEAQRRGDIALYSMIDLTGKPVVDIELALNYGYGVPGRVGHPTLNQIRGFRNECPPADQYIADLVRFLRAIGPDWILTHGRSNFDGVADGNMLARRWKELNR
jgi:hypothetical protein